MDIVTFHFWAIKKVINAAAGFLHSLLLLEDDTCALFGHRHNVKATFVRSGDAEITAVACGGRGPAMPCFTPPVSPPISPTPVAELSPTPVAEPLINVGPLKTMWRRWKKLKGPKRQRHISGVAR